MGNQFKKVKKSNKLENICFDIRGPIKNEVIRFEKEGYNIMKLDVGNSYAAGLDAPEEMIHDVVINVRNGQGYIDSKGYFPARKAVMQYSQEKQIPDVGIDDIFIGNGVSELIQIAIEGLLNNADEILVPCPEYPLWTAVITLSGGKAVRYICDEESDWYPDIQDIKNKITPKTRGIVIINPNNPTGAVYSKDILEQIVGIAREHNLIIFSDEICDKILFDDTEHCAVASLADDILILTFGGLSKNYRAPGFRTGWMIVSGNKDVAKDYLEGLEILCSMRLCSNVLGQFAVQTALGGYQSINDLTRKDGRICKQRDLAHDLICKIPGVSCIRPRGSFYMFPRIDLERYPITNDEQMILDLLLQKRVLLIQGSAFGYPKPDHFRLVFLPQSEVIQTAIHKLGDFLQHYKQI
ncbi:MAG: pyridoxal phosphate-dependent aminotransferase [bacterium]